MIHNGLLMNDLGQLITVDGSGGAGAGATTISGWACDATGRPYVKDVGAGAVPGTAIIHNGIALDPDGVVYFTSEAVAATDAFRGGLRVRADGAIRYTAVTTDSSDVWNGGWRMAATGEARVA